MTGASGLHEQPEREFAGEFDRLLYALWKGGYSPKEAADLFARGVVTDPESATGGTEAR